MKISHVIVNLKTNSLQHPRDQWKHRSEVVLALVNLPSPPPPSPITYDFLYVQGPISPFRVVFWTPKSDIKQIKKWKRHAGDDGAR